MHINRISTFQTRKSGQVWIWIHSRKDRQVATLAFLPTQPQALGVKPPWSGVPLSCSTMKNNQVHVRSIFCTVCEWCFEAFKAFSNKASNSKISILPSPNTNTHRYVCMHTYTQARNMQTLQETHLLHCTLWWTSQYWLNDQIEL